ncbi:MAG TPA: CinA family protein [Xanthobacteraceae bacterium]|nr:CinA family protein [Xanthobacteraceae bacterium]
MPERIEFTTVDAALVEAAAQVMEQAGRARLSLVTAESCTGGLVAAVLSDAPGAGKWLHGGFVTYTEENKATVLGVSRALIARAGAVSEPVARAMAKNALARSPADVSVAVTGVAGPATDDDGTPVGTVHFAAARRGCPTLHRVLAFGDIGRGPCRYRSVREAFALLSEIIDQACADAAGSARARSDRSAQR